MRCDLTDPSLKSSGKTHPKVNLMSSFATIKPLKYQLNQGRLEPKEQTPVKSLLHLFKGGCDLGSEIKVHWCDSFSRRSAMVLAIKSDGSIQKNGTTIPILVHQLDPISLPIMMIM
jgi:hypothetical protein